MNINSQLLQLVQQHQPQQSQGFDQSALMRVMSPGNINRQQLYNSYMIDKNPQRDEDEVPWTTRNVYRNYRKNAPIVEGQKQSPWMPVNPDMNQQGMTFNPEPETEHNIPMPWDQPQLGTVPQKINANPGSSMKVPRLVEDWWSQLHNLPEFRDILRDPYLKNAQPPGNDW